MSKSFGTGRAAAILGIRETKLQELLRRGKIAPPPEIVAGRRMWKSGHLLQAAFAMGLTTDQMQSKVKDINAACDE